MALLMSAELSRADIIIYIIGTNAVLSPLDIIF